MDEIKILSMLQEMQSFITVDKRSLDLAEKSNICSSNNTEFEQLVNSWRDGQYDEDPELLTDELIRLL